jgi:hypothetical protein
MTDVSVAELEKEAYKTAISIINRNVCPDCQLKVIGALDLVIKQVAEAMMARGMILSKRVEESENGESVDPPPGDSSGDGYRGDGCVV